MASAGSQQDELPEPPPPPVDAPPPPDAPAAPDATQVMVFTDSDEDVSESSATAKDGKKRKVHRIVIRRDGAGDGKAPVALSGSRSEEHTSELQSLMRISYAVFCWKKKNT